MGILRVYFARAVDGIDPDVLRSGATAARRWAEALGIVLVDPVLDHTDRPTRPIDIVNHDLRVLQGTQAVLMDMTIPNRNYIGCSMELVYARAAEIPSVVATGTTSNATRPWLVYHASMVTFDVLSGLQALARGDVRFHNADGGQF